ncbi:N-formylglutamate amidohydrolase [Rheinheimera sp. UJ51]|uniref:N-formylglutamate amidohydrolase n=1 Tax=unclassified Rheinheimera TaxID=115860 RepID=UPI001E64E46D|nr:MULTISPECIES: N-formylglutamate amidohydrolase [unclassified Rheinheimera]MCC5450359.1 N-formylglutamate amidohydrolase [Rheinheimera sp. UJ51]MCF4009207.1 N-formylglutamate amidohydrolase [Rheinheimera sp. UJ63]
MIKSFQLLLPEAAAIPLVFDSPHSGMALPTGFQCQASEAQMRSGWDAYVDELWQPATQVGATVLKALVSRMVIDLNRAVDDIDPDMIAGEWPASINPTAYSQRGMGLLRRYALPGLPMYQQPLSVADVQQRIADYYLPYHQCLAELLANYHATFGAVWHIDCHSMKSRGNAMNIDNEQARPSIVIGDKDGRSADADFTQLLVNFFENAGYSVAVNHPYKGGYLTECFADPQHNRHSVQIEINRALYMDEKTFSKHAGFYQLQSDLAELAAVIRNFISAKLSSLAQGNSL